MNNGLGLFIECVVAILLTLTVGYCILLNRRLKLFKADEESMRATISELLTATEIAERAIAGLKVTAHDCEIGLGERLRSAERLTGDLDLKLASGRDVLNRLTQIAAVGRTVEEPALQKDPHSIAAAAQAFAERLRTRVHGLAA